MNNAVLGILQALSELGSTDRQIAETWRPDDPAYRADIQRQIMMNLSYAYFVCFHADAEHPDWSPLWNPVYTCQPNPDDIYPNRETKVQVLAGGGHGAARDLR